MKLGSLFDGIGGFSLAAQLVGIKTLWSSEIEPTCEAVTKHHFPDVEQLGDITKIDGTEIEHVDIICGGSPCQDLSVAGKRAGLAGERSGLFMEQIRIIREMRAATNNTYPRYMVWENVPGALSSTKGDDFHAVLEETAGCAESGLSIPRPKKWSKSGSIMGNGWSIAWRILDAQYWGVPQRRKRIYLIADFGSERAGEILFEQNRVPRDTAESGTARQGTAGDAEGSAGRSGECLTPWDVQSRRVHDDSGAWPAIYGGEGGGRGYVLRQATSDNAEGSAGRSGNIIVQESCYAVRTAQTNANGIGGAQDAHTLDGANAQAVCYPVENHPNDSRFKLCEDGVVPTLSSRMGTGGNNGPMVMEAAKPPRKYIIRRLTPKECERLQGFPDEWTQVPYKNKPMSDSARYKMCGNSVAIPCVVRVMGGIADAQNPR